jgi:hypothetical protein
LGSSSTITDTGTTPLASTGRSSGIIHSRFPSSRLKMDHRLDVDTSRSGERKTGLSALGSQALQCSIGMGMAPRRRRCGELVRELGTDGPCINKCAGTWAEPRRGLACARAVSGSGHRVVVVAASSSALCPHHWGRFEIRDARADKNGHAPTAPPTRHVADVWALPHSVVCSLQSQSQRT